MAGINTKLLIHSVTLLHPGSLDRDGNKTTAATTINRVRVEYYNATTQGQTGAQTADGMTLYIDPNKAEYTDAEGGAAAAIIPSETDTVIYNGRNYNVKKIAPRYTRTAHAVHHYEVELV